MRKIFQRLRELAGRREAVHVFTILLIMFFGLLNLPFNSGRFNFDDYDLIINNPTLRSWSNLLQVMASGRPVRGLTLLIDYHLFGLDPAGYHLMNVAWHVACCILLYFLILRLTRKQRLAALTAFVFSVMPVHAEAVMNITHRKEMLALFFLLLAFHAWLSRESRPVAAYGAALLCFILGLLSKQVVLILPVLLVFHEWLRGLLKGSRVQIVILAALFLLAGGLLLAGVFIDRPVLRDFDLFGLVKPMDLEQIGYSRVLATAFSVFPRHLGYMFLPFGLTPHHLVEPVGPADPRVLLGLTVFLGLAALVWRTRRDFAMSFALGWIWINLLPIMNWVPSNAFLAERYLYIPSAGAALLIAVFVDRIFEAKEQVFGPRGHQLTTALTVGAIMLVILCDTMVTRINLFFALSSPYHLERGLAMLPSALVLSALFALAINRLEFGRAGKVIGPRLWLQAILVYLLCTLTVLAMPALMEALIHHRLGFPLGDLNQGWRDIRSFLQARGDIDRNDQSVWFIAGNARAEIIHFFSLSMVYLSLLILTVLAGGRWLGRRGANRRLAANLFFLIVFTSTSSLLFHNLVWSDELTLWTHAVNVEPRSAVSWNNLGKAYYGREKYESAADAYRKVIAIWPDRFENYRNLGICLVKSHHLDQAREAFEKALDLNPYDVVSLINLANLYFIQALDQSDPTAFNPAIKGYLKVLEVDPRSAHAHYNLAYCYYRLHKLDLALEHINKALMIDPKTLRGQELRQAIIQQMLDTKRSGP